MCRRVASAENRDLKGERHTSISAVTVRREWSTASALLGPPVMDEVALDGEGGGGSPGHRPEVRLRG